MRCSFCGGDVQEGRGKLLARTSGAVLYFCNSKCQRNHKLGRQGKKVRWTKTFAKEKQRVAPAKK